MARRTGAAAALLLLLTGTACPKESDVRTRDIRSTDLPPPRDGDVAIREELDAARRAGTRAALDLFIARHPRHPLADIARRERERLAGSGGR